GARPVRGDRPADGPLDRRGTHALGARRQEAQSDAGDGAMNDEVVGARDGSEAEAPTDGDLARALEVYLSAVEAGRAVDPDRLAAQHPAIADELRSCLEILRLAGRVEGEAGDGAAAERSE